MSTALPETQIYRRLANIERDIREIKVMLLKRRTGRRACEHPVSLEGLWAGAAISDTDLEAAKRSLFPFEESEDGCSCLS